MVPFNIIDDKYMIVGRPPHVREPAALAALLAGRGSELKWPGADPPSQFPDSKHALQLRLRRVSSGVQRRAPDSPMYSRINSAISWLFACSAALIGVCTLPSTSSRERVGAVLEELHRGAEVAAVREHQRRRAVDRGLVDGAAQQRLHDAVAQLEELSRTRSRRRAA